MLYREGSETDAGVKWVELSGADPVQVVEFKVTTLYTIEKKSISNPPDGQKGYRTGDRITYEITIYNTSPADLGNIAIRDELKLLRGGLKTDAMGKVELVADHSEGVTYDEGTRTFTVDSVLAGREKTFQYTYVVAQEDIGKRIENVATVEGMSTTPVYAETENKRITKQITDTEKLQDDGTYAYHVGNKINYKITVENVSSEELTNLTISDFMTYPDGARVDSENIAVNKLPFGVSWNAQRWVFEIKSIPSRGTVTITYTYTVDKDDFGKTIYNVAALDGAETEKTTAVITGARLEKRVENKKECYLPGDIVTYQITVTNTSSAKLTDLKVKDEINGKGEIIVSNSSVFSWDKEKKVFTIPELAAGKRVVITYNYKVDPDDVGRLKNLATIEGFPNRSEEDIVVGKVDLKKEIVNQAEKEPFQVGDVIQYKITVANVGEADLQDIVVEDKMTGAAGQIAGVVLPEGITQISANTYRIDNLPEGGAKEITYTYEVQPGDKGKTIANTAKVKDQEATTTTDVAQVTLRKTVANPKPEGEAFQPGETVEYKIEVKNEGTKELRNVEVRDTLNGAGGIQLTSPAGVTWTRDTQTFTIDRIKPGETFTITYTYLVHEDDAGETVRNVAIVNGETDEKTIEVGNLTFQKTITNPREGGEPFQVGDTIQYQIVVTNMGNGTVTGIKIRDDLISGGSDRDITRDIQFLPMAGVDWDPDKKEFAIDQLAGGQQIGIEYRYLVQPEDAGKTISNTAVMNGKDQTVETLIGEIQLSKTAPLYKDNGEEFQPEDRIPYRITVKNVGNAPLTKVKVKDALTVVTGEEENKVEAAATGAVILDEGNTTWGVTGSWSEEEQAYLYIIPALEAGQEAVIAYWYETVPEDAGKTIRNVALCSGKQEETTTSLGKVEVTKTVVNEKTDEEGGFRPGDVIQYQIRVKNSGIVPIAEVEVTDTITTGDEQQASGTVTWDEEKTSAKVRWDEEKQVYVLSSLEAGESAEIYYSYTVVNEDAGRTIINTAVAKGSEDTTTTTIGELELEKRLLSQPTHGDMFAAGDRILYEITVKNTGDTMLIQVPVKDMMANGSSQIQYPAAAGSDPAEDIGPAEGVTWDEENRVFTIARIPVGETVRIVYSYTPTEADEGKTITNLATVDGRETPAVPIVIQNKDLSIVKEILQWQEGKTYSVGEVIPYQITVANTGNAVLKDILVTDQIDGKGELQIQGFGIFGTNFLAQHAVEGNQVRIPELNPGEEVIIRCFYKVNSADNGRTVVNRATAKAEELEKEDKVSAEIKKAYNIYVNHVFANGEEDPNVKLPEDYAILDKEPGYTQSIIGEQVEGYTLFPRGEQNIAIVDQDVAITFVYYMDAIGTDPNHPDGIPDRYQITFQYISEDDNRGIVGGVVKEVHTIYHLTIHPDGFLTVGEIKPAVPSAEVTVDAQGQYLFARWTAEESKEFADVAEIRRTSFTENMVFTARFNPRSGGGNGGAGGSGGSGGGNGSTSISRVVSEGSDTITIDPEAVPLAMLPGGNGDPNALTNIEDEEVPLFGLPRTGDYGIPLNALIGAMILSLAGAMGILWKRKDEER